MDTVKIILFLMFLVSSAAADYTDTIDVYILSGQSNAAGGGYVKNLDHPEIVALTPWFPRPFVIDTSVRLLYGAGGTARCGDIPYIWMPLTNCNRPDEGGERFGPEIGFGNRMKQLDSKAKVAIIKFASSASAISRFLPGGDLNGYLAKAIDSGMALFKKNAKPAVIRGMLWHQGESDGGNNSYARQLVELINFIRGNWNVPKMPFVYGEVSAVSAQQKLVAEHSTSQYATPGAVLFSTAGFQKWVDEPDSPHPDDNTHYGTAGQLAMGKVMADSMYSRVSPGRTQVSIAHPTSSPSPWKLSANALAIKSNGRYSVYVYNLSGILIWKKSGTGPETIILNKFTTPGLYFIGGYFGSSAYTVLKAAVF